jgi:Ser/Thr protein kinase RdoA (MazF antagonist)
MTSTSTSGCPDQVLEMLGVQPRRVAVIKDVPLGNGNWLAETAGGRRLVVRRYHALTTHQDLGYEHAVLAHLARSGWVVPEPVSEPVCWQGSWWCLTKFVPGDATRAESAGQRSRRGRDLAKLHLTLRGLDERIGQRPGWRAQHLAVTVRTANDWEECVGGLASVSPRLASWARASAAQAHACLAAIGAGDLPVLVVHGDFTEWNVHYEHRRLAGPPRWRAAGPPAATTWR